MVQRLPGLPWAEWVKFQGRGSQWPYRDNVPKVPSSNMPLLPHKYRHAWVWCHSDKFQSLMAKLPGPIPVCPVPSCLRQDLSLTYQGKPQRKRKKDWVSRTLNFHCHCRLPTSPLITWSKESQCSLEAAGGGDVHCITACWLSLSLQQTGTLEGQFIPLPNLAQTLFMQRKKSGPAKGTVFPPY